MLLYFLKLKPCSMETIVSIQTKMETIQGNFKNKVGMPFGLQYMPEVKYIQFLTRNPIFKSKIANSGAHGAKLWKGKTQFKLFTSSYIPTLIF